MGNFFNNNKGTGSISGTTTIAAGTKITGEIDIVCNLHIDGEFEGSIKSKSFITIGKTGVVEGDISADKLIVSGKFMGGCECEAVEILPNGRVEGKVITKEFVIERAGIFVGQSILKGQTQADLIGSASEKEIKKLDSK